jgi:hypothetical protein
MFISLTSLSLNLGQGPTPNSSGCIGLVDFLMVDRVLEVYWFKPTDEIQPGEGYISIQCIISLCCYN